MHHDEITEAVREAAFRFVDEAYPKQALARPYLDEQGYLPALSRLIAEQGWYGIMAPEEAGGTGLGLEGGAIILEAAGRGIVAEPVFETAALVVPLLAQLGENLQGLLEETISGACLPALLHPWGQAEPADLVHMDASDRLTGTLAAVPVAASADLWLVPGRSGEGEFRLCRLAPDAPGVAMTTTAAMDGRRFAKISLTGAEAQVVAKGSGAEAAFRESLLQAALLSCAESLGSMTWLIATTADYLKSRRQFQVPLASFQVLQHRMVDMELALVEARSTLDAALHAAGSAAFPRAVALAQIVTARSARIVGADAVQLHGGIGMTDELAVSRHFKRLLFNEFRFGGAEPWLRKYQAA